MAYQFKTTKERSELMSKIRSNDTKPEIKFRKKLWGRGFRFNRKHNCLPGKPDIVLNKYKIAIFVDGEFWHGYNWEEKKEKIKSNRSYWIPKIERNISRDKKFTFQLCRKGWKVIRFWQKSIDKDIDKCLDKVTKAVERRKQQKT